MGANGFHTREDIELEIERLQMLSEDDRLKQIQEYKNPVPHLLSCSWLMEYILEWQIDHPLVVSKAFGNFPEDDENSLIGMSVVESAMKREIDYDSSEIRYIGVDIARFGDDKSVIIEMIGYKQTGMDVCVKQSLTHVAGKVVQMINNEYRSHRTIVLIDCDGLGSGVYDSLIESQENGDVDRFVEIVEIHFGSSPETKGETDKEKINQDKARFFNLKSRMFHLLADDLRLNISLFQDDNFLKELPTIRFKTDSRGRS